MAFNVLDTGHEFVLNKRPIWILCVYECVCQRVCACE